MSVDTTDIVPAQFVPVRQQTWGSWGARWDSRVYRCTSCRGEIDAVDGKTLREQAALHLLGSPECAMKED